MVECYYDKKIKSNIVYEDNWLKFYQDDIEFPNGERGTYAWADRKSGVGVVVITKDKKILLHKEFRYPIQAYSWEIQGGGIDVGESHRQAAVRELEEETGIKIAENQLLDLGVFYPLHSLSTEKGHLFMVVIDQEDVNTAKTEHSELIEDQTFFTYDEVLHMIDEGKINDSSTAHAVQLAMRKSGL